MNNLQLTDEQLNVVQRALDFYSRVGMGQFTVIKDHPSFQEFIYKICTPNKTPEVGDSTPQGKILEIKNGKALIDGSVKDGKWCEEKVWKKLKDVELSTDYSRYHQIRDDVDRLLTGPRNMLINDITLPTHGSWGIYNPSVDKSCRIAFDIIQVIRHEKWKRNPNRSSVTVDSHIHFSHREDNTSDSIICNLENQ